MKLIWSNLSVKARVGMVAAAVLVLGLILAWTQYGEYDTRDLPSKIRIKAKTFDGYHVHARVWYESTRNINWLCNNWPFSENMRGYDIKFDPVQSEGWEIPIKLKWPGFCKYEFNGIEISCDTIYSWNDPIDTIGGYSWGQNDISLDFDSLYNYPLIGTKITILKKGEETKYSDCDFDCKTHKGLGLFRVGRESKEFKVTCREGE